MKTTKANGAFTLSFNAILVQDKNSKGFTAYFKQFPNIIAEGSNENEALTNLFNALHDVFKHKNDSESTPKQIDHLKVVERSVNFQSLELA